MILISNLRQILRWSSKLAKMVSLLVKFVPNLCHDFGLLVSRSFSRHLSARYLNIPQQRGPSKYNDWMLGVQFQFESPYVIFWTSHYTKYDI